MKQTSYIKKTLTTGEQVIYQAKVHPAIYVAMIPTFLILEVLIYYVFIYNFKSNGINPGIMAYVFLLLPFLVFTHSWLIIKTTELALTNRRVISKTGIFTQKTSELQIGQIESVQVEQGIVGRMLNYGSVMVKGTGGGASPAPGIVAPFDFRKAVQELTHQTASQK
jgi:uncharacterized membrane protein YdbT with pleckstrin-like domain